MKVALLDGNSFCYRAFYAIRDLRNSKGEPTNAVYGFITMLERLLKDLEPDGVAVMFDVKGPTFRHERYQEYKIQRPPMPDELASQIPVIKEVIRAMNIPIFELQGYEADDLLATVARKLEAGGHETFIATGDKDILQLVTRKTKVVNPQKDNFIYDEAAVKARFGVGPDGVVEIMALMGDASDNIPGVPGIGEKTAIKLIGEYGTLEAVLKNVDKLSGDKLKENLRAYEAQARLSRELATVDTQVPVQVALESIRRQEPDRERLATLYQRLEFRTLLRTLPSAEKKNAEDTELRYRLVDTLEGFEEVVRKLSKKKEWAFDFETTGTDAMLAEPVGISFAWEEKEAVYVRFWRAYKAPSLDFEDPSKRAGREGDRRLTAEHCLGALKKLFEDDGIRKIGQNIKYEITILKNFGIELAGVWFDTMVASYCLNPAKPNHNLDDIAMEHLGIRITPITEILGQGKAQITMDEADPEKVYRYGCQDSDVTLRLSRELRKKLEEQGLWKLFEEIEMPLVRVLARIEYHGIAIDKAMLAESSREMEKDLAALTRKIHHEAGTEFNINSPKQLAEILFEKMKLPVVKKTKTGASTDVEVLKELSEIHSLPREILKFRELSKLKSTYVDALPLLVNPKTNRVHTSFNQTVTATGRLSSSEPNLQNIPVRTAEGRKIRRAFVSGSKGTTLVSADYSQIELRVLAHLSEDKSLIEAFRGGEDIHRYTASLIFNAPLAEVTDSMRESAKTVNFGILYGMGAFSLAKGLGITNEAASDFIKAYFDRYPRVKHYLDETLEGARKHGYVQTAFKRRRYIPDILSKDVRARKFAERTAINAPIQGTASDIIKIAMNRIDAELASDGFEARMILQVHDELLFEVPKDELEDLIEMAERRMQDAVPFKVPMKVSIKHGPNWLDMEEVTH